MAGARRAFETFSEMQQLLLDRNCLFGAALHRFAGLFFQGLWNFAANYLGMAVFLTQAE